MSESPASAEPTPRKRLSGWWYVAVAVALLVGLGLAVLGPVQQISAIKFLKAKGALLESQSHEPITVLGFAIPQVEAPTRCVIPRAGVDPLRTLSNADLKPVAAAWWAEHETLRRDLLSAVSKLPTLTSLSLAKMPVAGDDLRILRKLPNLKKLILKSSNATDAMLVHIVSNDQITGLDLSDTAITDAGIHELRQMSQLEELDLSKTAISDAGIHELRRMSQLIWLNLSDTAISDAGIHELRQMSQLGSLWLNGTDLTDKGVLELQHFPSLHQVLIRQTRLVHAKAFEELRAAAPGLEVLDDDW